MGGRVTLKYIFKKCRPNARMQMGVVWLRRGSSQRSTFLSAWLMSLRDLQRAVIIINLLSDL